MKMIQDLSSDVKEFLLSYSLVNQMTGLAQGEIQRIYTLIEAEVAERGWFSSVDFQGQKSWRCIQVWKKSWHPSYTQNAPWIHFEYNLAWAEQWVQASLDIESVKVASAQTVQDVVDQLSQMISSNKPALVEGQGWLLRSPLEGNRMFLVKRHNVNKAEFSGKWLFDNGIELFDQLSKVIPFVDQTYEKLFAK